MAAGSDIKAGKAFIELWVKREGFDKALHAAQTRAMKFGVELMSIGQKMAASGSAIAFAFVPTIKAASDAAETVNKFQAVFKEQTAAAQEFADNLAKQVGRSKYAIYDSLAALNAFFVGLGFESQKAREMAQDLAAMSLDFGSLYNISDQESVDRFISAMSGSSEVLDKFGINTKAAALEQELLAMGVRKSWTEVSEAEKVQARFNIILKSMTATGAIGDAVKTADSFANQVKALKGQIGDLAVEIGNSLLPAVTPFVAKAKEIVQDFGAWSKVNGETVVLIAKTSAVVATAGAGLYALGLTAKATAGAVGMLNTALTFAAANPALVAITALGAGIAVTTIAIDRLTSHTAELSDEMFRAREAADAKRGADQQAVRRLETLALQQSLTSQEMTEAKRIIDGLQATYGNLGVSIDQTTGKITGLHAAQQKLNGEMRRAAEMSIRAEISERQANVTELLEQMENPSSVSWWSAWSTGQDASDAPFRRAQAELDAIDALNARLRALASGDAGAVSGAPSAAAPGAAGLPAGAVGASDAAADFNARVYERLHDLRVAQIKDEEQREIEAIEWKYKQEMIEARKLNANLEALDYARRQEIEAVQKRFTAQRAADAKLAAEEAARKAELDAMTRRVTDIGPRVQFSGVGTFNAYQAATMAGGMSSPVDRLVRVNEQQSKRQQETNSLLTEIARKLPSVGVMWG